MASTLQRASAIAEKAGAAVWGETATGKSHWIVTQILEKFPEARVAWASFDNLAFVHAFGPKVENFDVGLFYKLEDFITGFLNVVTAPVTADNPGYDVVVIEGVNGLAQAVLTSVSEGSKSGGIEKQHYGEMGKEVQGYLVQLRDAARKAFYMSMPIGAGDDGVIDFTLNRDLLSRVLPISAQKVFTYAKGFDNAKTGQKDVQYLAQTNPTLAVKFVKLNPPKA